MTFEKYKTFNINMIMIVVCIMMLYSLACKKSIRESEPVVKPGKKLGSTYDDSKDVSPVESTEKSTSGIDRKIQSSVLSTKKRVNLNKYTIVELVLEFQRSLTHIVLIDTACGYYHDAYGIMPYDLDDMLDGFMPIWPGNIYTNEPIKILDTSPDHENLDHLGNIHYVRNGNHEATIQYLSLDLEFTKDYSPSWELSEKKVYSVTAMCLLYPDEMEKTPSWTLYKKLVNSFEVVRYRFGFNETFKQSLSYILDDALLRKASLDNSFTEMLINGQFYFSNPGLNELKESINNVEIYFSFGQYDDMDLFFFICDDPNEEIKPECRKFDPNKGFNGEIEYLRECPGFEKMSTSIISSKHFDELSIPEALLITKDDVK